MWDSNSPLQLLNSMPRKLSKENLEKLQLVIDADKYKNSLISGFDLCGMYAPFCRDCKKTSIYPCAIAYINMMKASGADIEIDAKPVAVSEATAEATIDDRTLPEVETEEQVQETAVTADAPVEVAEEQDVASEEAVAAIEEPQPVAEDVVPEVEAQPVKRKIRIAVARRKM